MDLGKSVLGILGNLIVLAIMSTRLFLAIFCIMPLHLAITVIYSGRASVLTKAYRTVAAQAAAIAQEAFTNLPILRAFCAEEVEVARYQDVIKEGLAIRFRQGVLNGVYFSVSGLMPQISTIVVLGYGGSLAGQGRISVGELTSFILYSNLLLSNIINFSSSYASIVNGLAAF